MHNPLTSPYDAILLYSFGGPNKPEEVVPFLRNVTAGKGIPDERLKEVGEHYYGFGGKSPINEQNLALKAALETELTKRGLDLPIVWGNRNWEPYTTDALDELARIGARKALMLVTSAYSSYSGCRQYREDMAVVQRERGDIDDDGTPATTAVTFDKIRSYFNHPGFVTANIAAVKEAWEDLNANNATDDATHIAFVTHSIPNAMEDASGARNPATYSGQHLALAETIVEKLKEQAVIPQDTNWTLSYCSRSGPPAQPWLEPDINDHLAELAENGTSRVVLAPIGFVSDHMEVVYDLDTEALATCADLNLAARRADTVGTRPEFVAGLVDLILERAAIARGEHITEACDTALPPFHSACPTNCCFQRHQQPTGIPTVAGQQPDNDN
ncbi:ferrochelatase [Timonella sp. A28]|uniref:ferrochelatase n=1 Tax=Timonella sp. A28 TaxID=3442640 RepID=UPI003EBBAF88